MSHGWDGWSRTALALQRRQDSHDARPRAQFDHLLASKIHILTFEIVTQAQSRIPHACRHPKARPKVLRDAQLVPTEAEPAAL